MTALVGKAALLCSFQLVSEITQLRQALLAALYIWMTAYSDRLVRRLLLQPNR